MPLAAFLHLLFIYALLSGRAWFTQGNFSLGEYNIEPGSCRFLWQPRRKFVSYCLKEITSCRLPTQSFQLSQEANMVDAVERFEEI